MTLRLRRGTDLERQSIVFQEGELVYVTDTQLLYVGDGTTLGGIPAGGGGGGGEFDGTLSSNLDLNGFSIIGIGDISIDGTISANSFSGDGSGLTNIPAATILNDNLDLNGFSINGIGDVNIDGVVIANSFSGDGSGLTNIPAATILNDNLDLNGFSINGVGDIIIDGIINATSYENLSLSSLSDISLSLPVDKEVLVYFNGQFINTDIPSTLNGELLNISIVGGDSSLFVDTENRRVNGDVFGSLYDSFGSVVFDTLTNSINVESINAVSTLNISAPIETALNSFNDWNVLSFIRNDETDISDPNVTTPYGVIRWDRNDVNGRSTAIYMQGGSNGLNIFNVTNGIFDNDKSIHYDMNGNLGLGTGTPAERLDVVGNANFTGTVTAEGFVGTGAGTPTLESATNLDLQAGNAVRVLGAPFRLANLTTTERNALSAANGDLIYNTTDNKIQAYQNGAWINLDNGTAA